MQRCYPPYQPVSSAIFLPVLFLHRSSARSRQPETRCKRGSRLSSLIGLRSQCHSIATTARRRATRPLHCVSLLARLFDEAELWLRGARRLEAAATDEERDGRRDVWQCP